MQEVAQLVNLTKERLEHVAESAANLDQSQSRPIVTARRHARIFLEKTKNYFQESELNGLKDKSEINIIERVPENAFLTLPHNPKSASELLHDLRRTLAESQTAKKWTVWDVYEALKLTDKQDLHKQGLLQGAASKNKQLRTELDQEKAKVERFQTRLNEIQQQYEAATLATNSAGKAVQATQASNPEISERIKQAVQAAKQEVRNEEQEQARRTLEARESTWSSKYIEVQNNLTAVVSRISQLENEVETTSTEMQKVVALRDPISNAHGSIQSTLIRVRSERTHWENKISTYERQLTDANGGETISLEDFIDAKQDELQAYADLITTSLIPLGGLEPAVMADSDISDLTMELHELVVAPPCQQIAPALQNTTLFEWRLSSASTPAHTAPETLYRRFFLEMFCGKANRLRIERLVEQISVSLHEYVHIHDPSSGEELTRHRSPQIPTGQDVWAMQRSVRGLVDIFKSNDSLSYEWYICMARTIEICVRLQRRFVFDEDLLQESARVIARAANRIRDGNDPLLKALSI